MVSQVHQSYLVDALEFPDVAPPVRDCEEEEGFTCVLLKKRWSHQRIRTQPDAIDFIFFVAQAILSTFSLISTIWQP